VRPKAASKDGRPGKAPSTEGEAYLEWDLVGIARRGFIAVVPVQRARHVAFLLPVLAFCS